MSEHPREKFLRNHEENMRVMRVAHKRADDAGGDDTVSIGRIVDAWNEIGEHVRGGGPATLALAQKASAYGVEVIEANCREIDKLRDQKADLLAACEAALAMIEGGIERDFRKTAAGDALRAAIANAKSARE